MVCNEFPVRAGQFIYSTLRLKPVRAASSSRTSRTAKIPWLRAASADTKSARLRVVGFRSAASADTKSARRGDYELKELKQLEPAMWLRVQKRLLQANARSGVARSSPQKRPIRSTPGKRPIGRCPEYFL